MQEDPCLPVLRPELVLYHTVVHPGRPGPFRTWGFPFLLDRSHGRMGILPRIVSEVRRLVWMKNRLQD